jgi:hypothetical protein
MKKAITLLSSIALFLLSFTDISAQTTFEVPANVQLNVKEDYTKYEPDIISASNWLESNPLDREPEKRKEVSAFVMKWIIGSPSVNVSLTEQIQKLYGKNASLLIIYMGSYIKHFLENKSTATVFSGTKAGLISMMNVYKKDIDIIKSKEMEKLIKLTDENKLDEYVHEKFK